MTDFTYGAEADVVTASTAGDRLFGGDGADTLTAIAGGNQLFGDAGDDVLNGASGNDVLSGGSSSDVTEHNVMHGFGGDDTIYAASQGDEVYGGDGNDLVNVSALRTGQFADGGDGTDTIALQALRGFSQSVFIQMGATFQPIVGGVNGPTYMNFENLYVIGGSGSNTIVGGVGDDTILNSAGDSATFQGGSLKGGAGKDEITFYGLPANGAGTMQLDGGRGAEDTLVWSNGLASFAVLSIDATAGTMTADGLVFANFTRFEAIKIHTYPVTGSSVTFTGDAEVDTLDIDASVSTLSTNAGNDRINLHSGQSNVHGGLGDDSMIADFSDAEALILSGDGGGDLIRGGSGQSTLSGGEGNDTVSSYNGRSHVFGGGGDDNLYLTTSYSTAGTGPAVINGGAGRDILALEFSLTSTVFVANFSKNSLVLVDGTQISGIEAMAFSSGSGNDNLTASNDSAGASANKLLGNGGNDILHANSAGANLDGGVGNDRLLGAGGADSLNGNLGDDVLNGGDGNDSLMGYFGKDVMTGGLGADHFLFTAATQSGKDAATRDFIQDFTQSQHDVIDLSAIDADGSFGNGKTAFTFIGAKGFSAHAGELRFQKINVAGTAHDLTVVMGDINGDGSADFQIGLKGLVTLHIGDFVLI